MGNNGNQEIFGILNNIMGQNGVGNIFNSQFPQQMGFDQNFQNIFSQFGNMGQGFNNYSNMQNDFSENYEENENDNENYEGEIEYVENEGNESETEEEIQARYIELRNSIINQLPRFKYSYYKNLNKQKEIQE